MSSLTIHNLDSDLEISLRKTAKENHESLNKTIQKLLRQALGLTNKPNDHKNDFKDLFGKWSKKDLKIFEDAISDFEQIDLKDWE
jgi:plasmid stability protein